MILSKVISTRSREVIMSVINVIGYEIDLKKCPVTVEDHDGNFREEEYMALTFNTGELEGETLLVGKLFASGDTPETTEISFDVFFWDKSEEESDELVKENQLLIENLITEIVTMAIEHTTGANTNETSE